MRQISALFLLLFGLLAGFAAQAQAVDDSYYLPQNVSYNAAVPTPRQFLGYQVGEWHVSHDQLVAYLKKIAETSNRVTVSEYGRTYENRPLLLLTITSPKNQAAIESLKAEHRKLVDPAQSNGLNTTAMPIVTWMGYTIHGNEPSGNNAALLAAYYLAAAQGPAVDSLLNEAIVLLDPCINPDGSNRFSSWVNVHKSSNLVTDPNSREFSEAWPGGRSNHYWFDLNRDYLYMQHPESKSRMVKFHEWKPNVLTDHHEMGTNSTFFFQPGVPTRTHPLTPRKNIELTAKIGNYHAAALDKIGSYYYTQENFDDYYYGKGSTYPDAHGSIGILFEQGSSRGHAQESQNGIVTFPFTIKNQFTATLSTLKASKEMRVELLNYQRDFYKEASSDAVKAYVFGESNDKARTWEMLNILQRNQIEVFKLSKDETIGSQKFTKGNSYVVPLSQPQHRLAKAIFEKRTQFEDSLFYDISAWSMPHCFNVPYAEVTLPVAVGEKIVQNDFPKGRVVGKSNYAYLFEWDSYFAPRAAYDLMKRGYRLKTASQTLTMNGRKFDYGTVEVQFTGQNPEATELLLKTIAERDGVDFYAAPTGLTSQGLDLGSENFRAMRQPKPLLVVGPGVNNLDVGEVWHLLDTRVNIPVTMAEISTINRVDLSKYNVIIMAGGDYNALQDEKIKTWLRAGGVLVAMGEALNWITDKQIAPIKLKKTPADSSSSMKSYALADRITGAYVTAGSIFEAKIDPTHPLMYGYKGSSIFTFRDNNLYLEPSKNAFNAPMVYTANPLVSGYIHPRNEKLAKNSPAIIVSNVGAGRVVSMTDNPNFRAFWWGTNKLFLNALFFGNQIGSSLRSAGVEEE